MDLSNPEVEIMVSACVPPTGSAYMANVGSPWIHLPRPPAEMAAYDLSTAWQAEIEQNAPTPTPNTDPAIGQTTVVNLSTALWIDDIGNPGTDLDKFTTVSAMEGTITLSLDVELASLLWQTGEGQVSVAHCTSQAQARAAGSGCTHSYQRASEALVSSVTANYAARMVWVGAANGDRMMNPVAKTSAPFTVRVGEVQSVNTPG
jgi:hypothetical protein